ncbi:MAG: zinc ribbon domain-containing protein [Candidatus Methanomethylophilaceae archaeon]
MTEETEGSGMQGFLSSKVAVPVGLLLTLLVCAALLYVETTGTLCFGTLLIAIAAYMIPRVFGMRDLKRILPWGIVFLFLISGVALFFTTSFYDSEEMLVTSSSDGVLVEATVSPHVLNDSGVYRFTVLVTETGFDRIVLDIGGVESVYLNYIMGGNRVEYNMSVDPSYTGDGTLYYRELVIPPGDNHFFVIKAMIGEEAVSYTALSPYPVLMPEDDATLFYYMGNLYYLSLNVGLPFFILASFSWWIRRNMDKTIKRMREEGRLPPTETTCPSCGHANPSALRHCSQCGEELPAFQPVSLRPATKSRETFICSECGADVDEDATECPNCGEPFDE